MFRFQRLLVKLKIFFIVFFVVVFLVVFVFFGKSFLRFFGGKTVGVGENELVLGVSFSLNEYDKIENKLWRGGLCF